MSDEIIQEVWRIKDCMAKKFNYNIDALAEELRKRHKKSGRKAINPKNSGGEKTTDRSL